MELIIEINNIAKSPVGNDFFVAIAKRTIREAGEKFLSNKKISLSVALVKAEEIKKINKIFRKKNEITDILSFSEYSSRKEIEKAEKKSVFLGELLMCYDDIKKYSKKEKLDFKKELTKVFSHGVLHLLGFKHGKKMFAIQNKTF